MTAPQMPSVISQLMSACFGLTLPNMNHVINMLVPMSCMSWALMSTGPIPIPSLPRIPVSKGPLAKCVVFIQDTLIVIVIIC